MKAIMLAVVLLLPSVSVALTPVVRGASIVASGATPAVVPFPTGTAAGDLVIVSCFNFQSMGTPSGWFTVVGSSGLGGSGEVVAKFVTSGDVAVGSVSIPSASGSLGSGVYGITAIVGPTQAGIRECDWLLDTSTGNATETVHLSSSVLTTDLAIYFGGARRTATGTISPGTLQGQSSGSASGMIYTDTGLVGGVQTITFSYGATGSTSFQAATIVKLAAALPTGVFQIVY